MSCLLSKATVIVCSFDIGLAELPERKQRNPWHVARHLARAGRFSVFDATGSETVARTMDWLWDSGWFTWDNSCGFPWTRCALTDVGRAALGRST